MKFTNLINILTEATFAGADIDKHEFQYTDKLLQDIKDGKDIRLGAKGETSVKLLYDIDNLQGAVYNLTANKNIFNKADYVGARAKFLFTGVDNKKYKITDIFKGVYSGKDAQSGGSILSALSTEDQENISAELCHAALNEPKMTDEELKNIINHLSLKHTGKECDSSWEYSFKQQYLGFLEFNNINILGKTLSFTGAKDVTRDGPFMTLITKVTSKLGFKSKDAWNPADIWICKNGEANAASKLKTILNDSPVLNSEVLRNAVLNMMMDSELLGVSLKKLGKSYKIQLINFENAQNADDSYAFNELFCRLDMQNNKFATKECLWKFVYHGVQLNGKYRSKLGDDAVQKPNALIYLSKGAKSQIGQVPIKVINAVFKKHANETLISPKDLPSTFEEFERSEVLKMVKTICKSNVVRTNATFEEAVKNIELVYAKGQGKTVLNQKLQSVNIAYLLDKAYKKGELADVVIELYYGAKKVGSEFGPYVLIADY